MKEAKYLLQIIKSFIENRESQKEEIDEKKLYFLAKKHKVNNFLIDWSKKYCQSNEIKEKIQADYDKQIIKDTNENLELENILSKFEEADIQTLVVKGIVMKNIYPQNYMRQMSDLDIMVEEKDFKVASNIMKKLGYSEFYDYEKHLIFSKKPFIVIEMHKKLLVKKDVGYEYLENIWTRCCSYKNYQNIVQLNPEEAYIFCILHLMTHFKFQGIRIRDILDVYLYHETYKNLLDYEALNQVFHELEIEKFEKNMKEIAYKWFGDGEIEDFTEVEKFILKGLSLKNDVSYHIGEKNGKSKYLIRLFFPEFKIMKEKYPILKKVPILLPATWIARLLKDIFSKKTTLKTRLDTIQLIQETKQEDVDAIHKIYDKLGIKGEKN